MTLDELEQDRGKITLWEWTREWLEQKPDSSLEEYLRHRADDAAEADAADEASYDHFNRYIAGDR